MKNKLALQLKLVIGFLTIAVLILIAGVLGIYSINWLSEESREVGVVNAPLSDAAMEIKLNAVLSHLKLEVILGGDSEESIEDVNDLIDEAIWFATAIIEGGENDEGTFFAVTDKRVIDKIDGVIAGLQILKNKSIE